jgi:hypothetical protein
MTKCGGTCIDIKDEPHVRIVRIPLPKGGIAASSYTVPQGCIIRSHVEFMRGGQRYLQITVDTKHQWLGNESTMPDGWDYRIYLRGGQTPVRRRVARRKAQREPGGEG